MKMCKEKEQREKNKKFYIVKRAGKRDRTPFINRTESFTMVRLIFHTAIIINMKNWKITIDFILKISGFFLKKRTYTHARTPLFIFVRFSMTALLPSQRTYFLNDPLK